MSIALAVGIVTCIGITGATILVIAAKFMAVEEDARIGIVAAALPGANCGACGYAGCSDYAKAVVEDDAPVSKCIPGGQKTSDAVAEVMGVEAGAAASQHAVVLCQGCTTNCGTKFDYQGLPTCAAAAGYYGGPSDCNYGCLGFGDCIKACAFDAITIVDGLSVIDQEKCTGCGACTTECPKHIITLSENETKATVVCLNTEKGGVTRKACVTGCIGCMKCVKTCQYEAIKCENNLATIDHEKCTGCGECVACCPVSAIKMNA